MFSKHAFLTPRLSLPSELHRCAVLAMNSAGVLPVTSAQCPYCKCLLTAILVLYVSFLFVVSEHNASLSVLFQYGTYFCRALALRLSINSGMYYFECINRYCFSMYY